MSKKGQASEDILEEYAGFALMWEARGRAEGKRTGWEKIIALLKQGYTVEQLERMDPAKPHPRQKPKGVRKAVKGGIGHE
jgi:hypothetical protein